MLCDENLKNLIQGMANQYPTLNVVAQAFAPIGERYHVGKLVVELQAPPSFCSRNGEHHISVLYVQDCAIGEMPDISREYTTGEKGTVVFRLYNMAGREAYTEQEKEELETVLDFFFIHLGRWRLTTMIQKVGHMDLLTGLPNAGGFLTYVDEVMRQGKLQEYNAYYFNLARFSLINKRFGVKETDQIILRYSQELMHFLQEGECIGRLGGDNFVALIRKERTYDFLDYISDVHVYGMAGNQKAYISVAAVSGVLEIPEGLEDCGRIINDCAVALNIAKHVERKPYVFASQETQKKLLLEKQMVSCFSKAIEKREFVVYYQPKVNTDDYTITGAEALVRWQHGDQFYSPADFIPVFEQNGMINLLDFYVLEQVCIDIRQWLKRGIEPVRTSVNFSRRHLTNPNLVEEVMEVLRKYELESKYIELELTETVDEQESDLLIRFMQNMKKYHVAMSIDDFGTGYSSLNMLRSFPVDVLKIDKTLIGDMEATDRIILSNIIRMAEELQMEVVVEGVETQKQLDYLKDVKCRIVQGYLFDRPMPKEQFEEKMISRRYQMGGH